MERVDDLDVRGSGLGIALPLAAVLALDAGAAQMWFPRCGWPRSAA